MLLLWSKLLFFLLFLSSLPIEEVSLASTIRCRLLIGFWLVIALPRRGWWPGLAISLMESSTNSSPIFLLVWFLMFRVVARNSPFHDWCIAKLNTLFPRHFRCSLWIYISTPFISVQYLKNISLDTATGCTYSCCFFIICKYCSARLVGAWWPHHLHLNRRSCMLRLISMNATCLMQIEKPMMMASWGRSRLGGMEYRNCITVFFKFPSLDNIIITRWTPCRWNRKFAHPWNISSLRISLKTIPCLWFVCHPWVKANLGTKQIKKVIQNPSMWMMTGPWPRTLLTHHT